MIGQNELLSAINLHIDNFIFPRFCLIVGSSGSEKNQVAEFIAKKMNATCVTTKDCKVETIREIINSSYKVTSTTVYNIADADTMSLQAKNALLKVTEEPPNKAYFVITLEDINNTLPTIQSRGTLYLMEPYTQKDLVEYCGKYKYNEDALKIVLQLCDTPGMIDLLNTYKPKEFYDFVSKVVDNIATVNGSNVFKIGQSIKFKDTDENGYDLNLFWKAFCVICYERELYSGLKITSHYISQTKSKSVNRAMLFDKWILDIRQEWMNEGN